MPSRMRGAGGRLALCAAVVICLGSVGSAAAPFVDASTRNGSFETGSLAPWSGFGTSTPTPTIVTDPTIASDGQRFARLSSIGSSFFTGQSIIVSSPALDPALGNIVRIEFDARVPANGDVYNHITLSAFGSSPSDSIIIGSAAVEFDPLTSAAWAHQVHDLMIDPAKMAALPSMSFGMGFWRQPAVTGLTYVGWVDNVTMTQIPEPAGIGAAILIAAAIWRPLPRRTRRKEWTGNFSRSE